MTAEEALKMALNIKRTQYSIAAELIRAQIEALQEVRQLADEYIKEEIRYLGDELAKLEAPK